MRFGMLSDKVPSPQLDPRRSPSTQYKRRVTVAVIVAIGVVGLSAYLEVNLGLLFTDFHYLTDLVAEMVPPNMAVFWEKENILVSISQTVSMAFLGTLFGGTLALGLAFLAARNTSPHPLVRTLVRSLLALERVIPGLVILLVMIIVVGLGPFAGMVSLTIGTVGIFGKLFADSIEGAEQEPIDGVLAVGATSMQAIRYGLIPQVLPALIGNLFYAFEINLRAAIGLGVFGGAGIGYEIHLAMQLLRYRDALALISITVVLVFLVEKVSDWLRANALGQEGLV